jgi:hypothetical protein
MGIRRFLRMKKSWIYCILFLGIMNLSFSQELYKEENSINLYKSVDVALMSDIAPINVAFNIGVEKIYGSIIVSYYPTFSPEYETKYIGLGFGIGSNIFINKNIYFNPEIVSIFTLESKNTTFLSIKANIGYQINSFFSIFIGPGITWINHPVEHHDFHFIGIPHLGRAEINEKNSILFFGTKIGIRLIF